MNFIDDMKLGAKISFLTVVITAVIFIGLTFYILSDVRGTELESAYKYSESLAKDNASIIKAELERALASARTLSQVMQGYENIETQDRREYYNSILKQVVETDDKILGVWTCWEPYVLDGLDKKYINKDGHDSTGRFIPHWIKTSRGVVLQPLKGLDNPVDNHLKEAFDAASEIVMEPYSIEIQGQKKQITSLVVPITDKNGQVLGVTGVDLELDTLQSVHYNFGEYDDYYYFLMSGKGQYVLHKGEYIGKNFKDVGSKSNRVTEVFEAISSGNVYSFKSQSTVTYTKCWHTIVPVHIGDANAPWGFGFVVEMGDLTAKSNGAIILLVGIFLVVLAAIAASIIFVVSKVVTKPISNLVEQANKLAIGNTDLEIDTKSKDELGELMRSFQALVRNIKQQSQYAEQIASGNLKLVIKPRSDKDVLSKSMQYVVRTLNRLVAEAETLTKAAVKGQLATRGNEMNFKGGYKEIVAGFNKTLDGMVTPINEASDVLSKIEQGNLGARVVGVYQGDFAKIKTAVNTTGQELQGYIAEVTEALTQMANSNLDVEITRDYLGDFNQMKLSINNISDSFNLMAAELQNTSEQVEAGASDVANTSQILTQGSAEQASSVEEISAVITQVSSQTKQNADNANEANDIAIKARSMAEQGNQQMKDMLLAMNGINDSSRNISKIIRVIDGIAFQTKILSLNAAVEAARAGEYGKGFAVVAEEVRNLAARSANAAQETTDLIDDTLKRVHEGTNIANATAAALDKIVTQIAAAGEIIDDIADASNEQAAAIEEISEGIIQVSNVTQANTATAEQSAAASEEMSTQAQLLNDLVGQFTLKNKEIDREKLFAAREMKMALAEAASTESVEEDIILNQNEYKHAQIIKHSSDNQITEEYLVTEPDLDCEQKTAVGSSQFPDASNEIDSIEQGEDGQDYVDEFELDVEEDTSLDDSGNVDLIEDQELHEKNEQVLDEIDSEDAREFLQGLINNSFSNKKIKKATKNQASDSDVKKGFQELSERVKNRLKLWKKK